MEIIMSIKPKFVDKIFSGEKKYEFRKRLSNNILSRLPLKVLIYETAPISKIVGEMYIDKIIVKHIDDAWNMFKNESGLGKEEFFEYYKNNYWVFALHISSVEKYNEPFELSFRPPQSYCILKPQNNVDYGN